MIPSSLPWVLVLQVVEEQRNKRDEYVGIYHHTHTIRPTMEQLWIETGADGTRS